MASVADPINVTRSLQMVKNGYISSIERQGCSALTEFSRGP